MAAREKQVHPIEAYFAAQSVENRMDSRNIFENILPVRNCGSGMQAQ
jgi:hypothetical protein